MILGAFAVTFGEGMKSVPKALPLGLIRFAYGICAMALVLCLGTSRTTGIIAVHAQVTAWGG